MSSRRSTTRPNAIRPSAIRISAIRTSAIRSTSRSLATASGAVAGRVLQAAVTVLALARPADRPMHPLGQVFTGRLHRSGSAQHRTGSAFLDAAGDDEVLVRVSRAVGLRSPLLDINGLAVRVPAQGGDLLLSTTGWGRLTRYLLVPHRGARAGTFTCLVPYRTATGPVHIGAYESGADRFELFWSRPRGGWHRFGEIVLSPVPDDVDPTFDAILRTFAGLDNHEWYRRLRAPSYAAARRLRGAPTPG
jgi:hypothetical protein